jgi:hypothetical protein
LKYLVEFCHNMAFVPHSFLVLSIISFIPGIAYSHSHDQDCYPDFPVRDGLLCYPKCKAGYANYGQGPVCWGICPKKTTNIGVSCQKNYYGRGVGVPLSTCPSGTEKSGALCYPLWKAGYYGVGPVCWQYCKKGLTDDGALCRQPLHVVGRNTGYSINYLYSLYKWPIAWAELSRLARGTILPTAACIVNTIN